MKTITTTMTLLLVTKSISHSSAFVLPTMNRIAFHTRSATKIQGSRIIVRRRSSPMEGFLSRTLCLHRREVHLPPHSRRATSNTDIVDSGNDDNRQSVTGPIYDDSTNGSPQIKLFTKEGCTLCDKVKDVLESVRESHPHSLYAIDITDDDKLEWFSKYKYDIPVLHINDIYWTKHRLSEEDSIAGIEEARAGEFQERQGEPDAGRLERT